jgi:methionyl-tRNA formyltransferase|tara:strand:- start:295 stop:945 length:651 start_codon:yes stop_codon:yes gene_type:complete
MDKTILTISILVDDLKCWFIPFAKELINILKEHHNTTMYHHAKDIPNGDLAFFLACSKIVPSGILKRSKHNLVVHESNLPKGRGWSPLSWQVEEGKKTIPIVLFEGVEELDAGPIYLKEFIELDGTELYSELKNKQGQKTIKMVLEFIDLWPNVQPTSQEGKPTFYRKRNMKDNQLDPEKTLAEQFDKLRTSDNSRFSPWFSFRGRKYKLAITPYE